MTAMGRHEKPQPADGFPNTLADRDLTKVIAAAVDSPKCETWAASALRSAELAGMN